MTLTPTPEQSKVIELALDYEDLKINAFAGASKTTTLTMIANAKHEEGGNVGMYLAFNKVTALEAENRFPNSVECKTVHSLAYRHTPKDLISKLNLQKVFPKDLGLMYKFNGTFVENAIGDRRYISVGAKVSMMNRTISRFCNSADDEISRDHLVRMDWMRTPVGKEYDLEAIYSEVVELAKIHWQEVINPSSIIPLTHEAYLKLYSMSGRKIIADYIMIDENQDSSPVILKIVESQKKAQKIYVGDRYQAIYGWRGAINAMDIVTGTDVYLTKSFRFGNNVEKLANLLLDHVGNEVPLHGNGSSEGITYNGNMSVHPDAVICRTNTGVIKNIFEYSDRYPHLAIGASCDLREIEKFVYAYTDLSMGKKVEHQLLFAFNTVSELRDYCEENPEDMEISGLVKLIDKFTPKGLLSAIKKCDAIKKPDIMVTTAHKSKGLEWNNVLIYNDFFYDVGEDNITIDNEELNLLYVACTRAKKHIDILGIGDLIYQLLKNKGDKEELTRLGFHSEDEEYGNDEVAQATGGVLVGVKGFEVFSPHELNVEAKMRSFIDKTCSIHHKMDAEFQDGDMGLTDFN